MEPKNGKTYEEMTLEELETLLFGEETQTYPEPCGLCGSEEHTFIGTLGDLDWWRCRGCGCESNTKHIAGIDEESGPIA